MSVIKQKEFAIILFVLPLLLILFNFYTNVAGTQATELINWGAYLWNFSMIIGTYSMFRKHVLTITERQKDWPYSIIMFVSFFAYFISGYIHQPTFKWIMDFVQTPIMLSIWVGAFTTFTMIFRGARTRNWLGVLLLFSTIMTVLRMAPIGQVIWSGFPVIGNWINTVPNVAVMRAITIGMGIGLLATMTREILGKETHYLGE
jgi:hypothetical protein